MNRVLPIKILALCLVGASVLLTRCGGSARSSPPPPPPSAQGPQLSLSPASAGVPLGGNASFRVTTSGNPSPNVDCALNGAGSMQLSGATLSYTAPSTQPTNLTVIITCTASNTAGSTSATAVITLVVPALSGNGIPATFFSMSTVDSNDFPVPPIGTLGHPATFAWGWIERSKGVYSWAGFDKQVEEAKARGLVDATNTAEMILTFGWTPGWAAANPATCHDNRGVTLCTSPPANLQDWTDFVTAVIQHYNGVTEPHLRYYETWNEANSTNFWSGSIADMVALAQAAFPIIHSDPHSMLLTPSVAGPVGTVLPNSAELWMAQYLDAGGSSFADGGTFHGYIAKTGVTPYPTPEEDSTSGCTPLSTCFGSILTKTQAMRAVFDAHGLAGKPLFNTEGSWGNNNVTDPDSQVAWLARWLLLQAGLRSTTNLEVVSWYTWGGLSAQPWGGIEDDAMMPTQAGLAYGQVFNWLVGATLDAPCRAASDSTWTCDITRPGGYTAQAVWNTSGTQTFFPGPQFTRYRDLAGGVFQVGGTGVMIGAKPILLESGPPPS